MKKIENEVTAEERAAILIIGFDRRTTVSLLGNSNLDNSWYYDIPHQPNKIRYAMQIAMDNKKYLRKALRFVEGTLYFYDKEQVVKKDISWHEDFDYTGFQEWFKDCYGLILSLGEINFVVNLCVHHKLIPKMSRDKFNSILVMEALVNSNKPYHS